MFVLPVSGMPFRCHVDAVGGGYVTAFGQGLHFGSSGQGCDFTVVGGGGKIFHFLKDNVKIVLLIS